MIAQIRIPIIRCTEGVYLRWYFNGWHYYNFQNKYEVIMKTESMDTQVLRVFSVISKIERPTKLKSEYAYQIEAEGIPAGMVDGFNGLLMAEKVEQYESAKWYEVDITRGDHAIKEEGAPGYRLTFEITRKELPNTPAVFQKTQLLYIGDTLADLDDEEVIPINKQVNDIGEMQDRQSDYTAGFKVRKTRAMMALFELSGEVGANTTFPYEKQNIRLIQDGIEIISVGYMILDKVEDQYYNVSVYSGNLNFFKQIEDKKLSDLALNSLDHTWNIATQAATHAALGDYIYPLCEPSNDGALLTDTGSQITVRGKYIWPFVRLKTIWDAIFTESGHKPEGDIITNLTFLRMYMPIAGRKMPNANMQPWLFSLHAQNAKMGSEIFPTVETRILNGQNASVTLISGKGPIANYFKGTGIYITPISATYKIRCQIVNPMYLPDHVYLYSGETQVAEFTDDGTIEVNDFVRAWSVDYEAAANEFLTVRVHIRTGVIQYDIQILNIDNVQANYGSYIMPRFNLPDMSQTDFIKMICNVFGLVPDVNARTRKINFWNYSELYDNTFKARDWSAYLSEREDETEFKFGDYAQNNYLKYKESEDVIKDNGRGTMQVDDETLPIKKDVVELPISTCDEVIILTDQRVSRIAFNEYDFDNNVYDQKDSIDPRIVYVSQCPNTKSLVLLDNASPAGSQTVTGPYKASSLELSMSTQITNYAGLSRMLTKTNLRRAKFNLPVYEVAGFKYNIPIYLSQYKAYFYVNKINNYVPGKLCVIDLIKL